MWIACALIVLFSIGFVLPCMLDVATTADSELTSFTKGTWLLIVGAFWVFGAIAWLLVGRPRRPSLHRRSSRPYGIGQADALLRHPAAQATGGYVEMAVPLSGIVAPRPLGPDDDDDFLMEINRRIREARGDS